MVPGFPRTSRRHFFSSPKTSNCSCTRITVRMSGWKRYAFVIVIFIAGMIFDHFVIRMEVGTSRKTDRSLVLIKKTTESSKQPLKKHSETKSSLSIKKNLETQFKDYLPRKIFINCGGILPSSVELFRDNYPCSHNYHTFSFIPEVSYKPLYSHFERHIFIPVMCADTTGTRKIKLRTLTNSSFIEKVVNVIGISDWMLENTHPDEYMILKLDLDYSTLDTINKLINSVIIDWIAKVYISGSRPNTETAYQMIKRKFQGTKQSVGFWNGTAGNYSDLDKLNPPNLTSSGKNLSHCKIPSGSGSGLLLYSSDSSIRLNATLTILMDFLQSNPELSRYPGLFLPINFLRQYKSWLNQTAYFVDIGIYYNTFMQENNCLRNGIISAENIFKRSGYSLKNVYMAGNVQSEDINYLTEKRSLNVYHNIHDVTFLTKYIANDTMPDMSEKLIKSANKTIFAVNLDAEKSYILPIYWLSQFRTDILKFNDCKG